MNENTIQLLKDKIASRLQQELLAEIENLQTKTIQQYAGSVSRCAWRSIQKWCVFNDDGLVTFPDHTRMYYRKGNTEILLQEFPPQIRLLKIGGSLAKRSGRDDILTDDISEQVFNYSLAFPYLVFIYKFENGLLTETYLTFCDQPLKNLKERPLIPYLPNLDPNLKICLGTDFNKGQLKRGELTQQVAFMLGHFWQSIFNHEWANHFWRNKEHFATNPSLCDLEAWRTASLEDPLFVIDVSWLQFGTENYGDIVARLFETDSHDKRFQEELVQQMLDSFLEEVEANVQKAGQTIVEKSHLSNLILTELRNSGIN